MSVVETVITILLVLIIIFNVGRWRYWRGYKAGFEEGITSGRTSILREIENMNDGGHFQKILDANLDKNPGFISLMNDLKVLVVASRKVWDEHGSSGDELDKALERFSEEVKYDDEPEREVSQ